MNYDNVLYVLATKLSLNSMVINTVIGALANIKVSTLSIYIHMNTQWTFNDTGYYPLIQKTTAQWHVILFHSLLSKYSYSIYSDSLLLHAILVCHVLYLSIEIQHDYIVFAINTI